MKKCTQCGQILSHETNFCYKCGGASFAPAADAEPDAYQQPPYQPSSYQQPSYQPAQQPYYQTPSYQQAADDEPVSIGMNLLFLILASIPIVNIIYAIVVAVSSRKKSYRNLALAWFITLGIGIVLLLMFSGTIVRVASDFARYY